MGTRLPTITGEADDISIPRHVIKETQKKMTRKYREVANRKRKKRKVNSGALVWVKRDVNEPGVCKKLCDKWKSPYKVVKVLRDGGGYIVKDPFTGQMLQRAAEKVKTFGGSEVEPQDAVFQTYLETKVLPPWARRRPRRYVEEC